MTQGPRIVLIGGTYRALCALERLLERGERVVGLIGQEGGGERDFCPEILELCDRASIPARSGRKFGEEIVRWLDDRIRPDVCIAVGVNVEIPLAIGGNSRLGFVELTDPLLSDGQSGVVLRRRGQELIRHELAEAGDDEEGGDFYLRMVDQLVEVLDEYLDGLRGAGNKPAVSVPFERPRWDGDETELLTQVVHANETTDTLEREAAAYLGAEHVLALRSPHDAFELLLEALPLTPGDEVICPAIASAELPETLTRHKLRAVPTDVGLDCLTLDPRAVREAITPRTRALLIAHAFGQPAALDELYGIAAEAGLEVIEDAGASLGARFGDSRIGRAPCTCVFRVPLGGPHGAPAGALLTLSGSLAEAVRPKAEALRMSGGAAELALRRLSRNEEILSTRRAHGSAYSAELCRYDAFRVMRTPAERLPLYAGYVLRVTQYARTTADDLHKLLAEDGIETRRLEIALPERAISECPIADLARGSGLLLPCHESLTDSERDAVLDAIFDYAIG